MKSLPTLIIVIAGLITLLAFSLSKVFQKPTSVKATVHWRENSTGLTGHGEPINRKSAEAWVKKLNAKHPDMKHWIE